MQPQMPEGTISAEQYQQYIQMLQQSITASSGFEQLRLKAQLKDAQKARDNALALGRLQAETSRYGVDQQRATAMAQLQQRAKEFDATHALDLQRFGLEQQTFGLDYAKAATAYMQTPDQVWALRDFNNAVTAAGLRQPGPSAASQAASGAGAVPKTAQDFAVLAGYASPGTPGTTSASGGLTAPAGSPVTAGGGAGAPGYASGGMLEQNQRYALNNAADPRLKAMKAIGDAIPPSAGTGTTDQDWAALNAIQSLYFSGKPGTVEQLDPTQRKTAQAGLARLGYSPDQVEYQRQRSLPGQQSVRLA